MQNQWGISEQELENRLCENPNALQDGLCIIERQVPLPYGILDILGYRRGHKIIELKARPLKEQDVGQVLRYTHDVQEILLRTAVQRCPVRLANFQTSTGTVQLVSTKEDEHFRHIYFTAMGYSESQSEHIPALISPILIGPSADNKIVAAAHAANIEIYLWNFDPQTESIIFKTNSMGYNLHSTEVPGWAVRAHQLATKRATDLAAMSAKMERDAKILTIN